MFVFYNIYTVFYIYIYVYIYIALHFVTLCSSVAVLVTGASY